LIHCPSTRTDGLGTARAPEGQRVQSRASPFLSSHPLIPFSSRNCICIGGLQGGEAPMRPRFQKQIQVSVEPKPRAKLDSLQKLHPKNLPIILFPKPPHL